MAIKFSVSHNSRMIQQSFLSSHGSAERRRNGGSHYRVNDDDNFVKTRRYFHNCLVSAWKFGPLPLACSSLCEVVGVPRLRSLCRTLNRSKCFERCRWGWSCGTYLELSFALNCNSCSDPSWEVVSCWREIQVVTFRLEKWIFQCENFTETLLYEIISTTLVRTPPFHKLFMRWLFKSSSQEIRF